MPLFDPYTSGPLPADEDFCPETSDGYHCGHWQEGFAACCACGQDTPDD